MKTLRYYLRPLRGAFWNMLIMAVGILYYIYGPPELGWYVGFFLVALATWLAVAQLRRFFRF